MCNGSGTESAADLNDPRSTQGYKDKKGVSKMKIEEIRVRDRIRMRGLKNKGMIEISQDPKTGDFVLILGKGFTGSDCSSTCWRGRGEPSVQERKSWA